MGWPSTEAELAAALIEDLRARGWTIYQEVETFSGGPRADIVAAQGPVLWVVETKRSLGLAVLAQADYWLSRAHLVSVAVPYARPSNARDLLGEVGFALGLEVHRAEHRARFDVGTVDGDLAWLVHWLRHGLRPHSKQAPGYGLSLALCSFEFAGSTETPSALNQGVWILAVVVQE